MNKFKTKIDIPFIKKGTVYYLKDGDTWEPENGAGLTFHCDFYNPFEHPEVFERIKEPTSLEKWILILKDRNKRESLNKLRDSQIEHLAIFLDHYEYDPDFVWLKHTDRILGENLWANNGDVITGAETKPKREFHNG